MQEINHLLIKSFAKFFIPKDKKILEVGSFVVPGQEKVMDLRQYFKGANYIGVDMRVGLGVDAIENVENLSYKKNTFDLIICLDTFEHVENPIKAGTELYRVMRKDGILILSSVMNFGIHDFPNDYWRFTPESFDLLTSNFNYKYIGYLGCSDFPQNVYAICYKGENKQKFNHLFKNFYREFLRSSGDLMFKNKLLNLYVGLRMILSDKKIAFRFVNKFKKTK